jgi:hypothetical protein
MNIVKVKSATNSSAAQQRFELLLRRVEKLTQLIEDKRAMAVAHRPAYQRTLDPVKAQLTELMRALALKLDERLQASAHESDKKAGKAGKAGAKKGSKEAVAVIDKNKLLTKTQRATAVEILCTVCSGDVLGEDPEMKALYDRYSDVSLGEQDQAAFEMLQTMLTEGMGIDLSDLPTDASPEELIRLSLRRAHAHAMENGMPQGAGLGGPFEQLFAPFQNASGAGQGKPSKAAQKREKQAAQTKEDAQEALRTIYRQLASALHPDREPDEAQRAHKTALMSEANAAYERRDLMALLALQLRIVQVDHDAVKRMTAQKMNAFTALLKEQVAALERDQALLDAQIRFEFDMPSHALINRAVLERSLMTSHGLLLGQIHDLQIDLGLASDDSAFKDWLKVMHKVNKEADDFPMDFPF